MLRRTPNPKEAAMANLLGAVVVTYYNNKSYRIDDIAWDLNPRCKFPYKGKEITYMDFYQTRYQVKIRDVNQPLLVSKPKKKDLRRGCENIILVPELCLMTGFTDEMRADFNMMKDLAEYLRSPPDQRVNSLMAFNSHLVRHERVKEEMASWGLEISNRLLEVNGRMLPDEVILQGGETVQYNRNFASWSKETQSRVEAKQTRSRKWAIVFPNRYRDNAKDLCTTLQRVGPPMGMQFSSPLM
ncbi:Piwi-like protein 1 [Portunus trituberculatus]|uniref:Piwi-like protein 1 n=1 Tax=Portunus trituberculatus TaxID=210409 RepID=A0A5B7G685_PORTR|nr:Piwi-like protein 1 [Portunus trituberculatus]